MVAAQQVCVIQVRVRVGEYIYVCIEVVVEKARLYMKA